MGRKVDSDSSFRPIDRDVVEGRQGRLEDAHSFASRQASGDRRADDGLADLGPRTSHEDTEVPD